MRILVINWQDRKNPQAGGAEAHLHETFGRIARRGHEVTVLASGWPGAPGRERVDGLDVHRTGGRYTFGVAAPFYYGKSLRGRDFDIIVEDLNKVPLFTPLWGRHPVSLIVHHLFGRTAFQEAALPLATATWLLERPLGPVYRRVPAIAVSESTAADLRARGLEGPIAVVPNGVDLDRYTPDPGQRFELPTVLYLGRLKRYKRIDLILRAVARLRERGLEARCILAGRGDHAPALRRLVAALGLGDTVDMPGFVPEEEKVRLFRGAWVHVLTSPREGWGITNLEAAACGTPTVASDSPGLRDSVQDGETGFLAAHGDVEGLAERIGRILREPELRERLGRGARTFAEGFTWDRTATATLAQLRVVTGTEPRRPAT